LRATFTVGSHPKSALKYSKVNKEGCHQGHEVVVVPTT